QDRTLRQVPSTADHARCAKHRRRRSQGTQGSYLVGDVPGRSGKTGSRYREINFSERSSETGPQDGKIQLLPADQLIPSMQFMASSLGVHCDHCHVEHAFEKDDKKAKQQAREMIKMVTALNANSLSGTRGVTCYSCHRGSLVPKRTPVVQGEPAMQPVAAPVAGSSTKADEI